MKITLRDEKSAKGLVSEIRVDRLWMLYAMLDEIAEDEVKALHFNLDSWVLDIYHGFDAGTRAQVVVGVREDGCLDVVPTTCGFAACVMGWAGSLPEFNRLGFCLAALGTAVAPVYHEAAGTKENWSAVCKFLRLEPHQADFLFKAGAYMGAYIPEVPTAREVADRLAVFIEENA